jgi:hypothetical protein
MATIISTSRFFVLAKLIFEFLLNICVQVSPSVRGENSVSVVIKTLWVKASQKTLWVKAPLNNTWPTRPPFWVKITTRTPGHKTPIRDPSPLQAHSMALPGHKVLIQVQSIKTLWVEAPQKSLWVKAPQTTSTLPGTSTNQHFISHTYKNSILFSSKPSRSITGTLNHRKPNISYSVGQISEISVDLLTVKPPDKKIPRLCKILAQLYRLPE